MKIALYIKHEYRTALEYLTYEHPDTMIGKSLQALRDGAYEAAALGSDHITNNEFFSLLSVTKSSGNQSRVMGPGDIIANDEGDKFVKLMIVKPIGYKELVVHRSLIPSELLTAFDQPSFT